MKKLALSLIMLGGIGFIGAGSVSAADWSGNVYRPQPVGYSSPVYRNNFSTGSCCNGNCSSGSCYGGNCSTGSCHSGNCSTGSCSSGSGYPGASYRSGPSFNTGCKNGACGPTRLNSYRRVPRHTASQALGFSGSGLNFWYGR